ncbi:MAG: MBL fold metallo-hydrolase [Hyphomicrobiaceae bacterium]
MQSISRRSFVISAAAAGAAFGLDGPLEFIRPARAQTASNSFAKFKVGDWNVTTVYDGIWEKAHDPGFIKNASVDDTKAELRNAGMTDAFVPVPFTVTLVEKDGKIVMFDAGTGGQLSPKAGLLAKQNLKAAGIDADKISTIVVTHFHPDHIFGLMAKDTNAQIFPNAEIVVPAGEYKYWTDPALLTTLPAARQGLVKRVQATMPSWKNLKQVADGAEATAGIRALNTNGHTPGHTSYELASGSAKLIVTGDVTNIPALFMKHPGWHAAFDQDAALAEKSRKAVFSQAVSDGSTLTGYHWGMPGAGTIKKDGDGYALVPVTPA